MQYTIHEDNLPKLIEKLKRIENKCNKYGCTFNYAEIGEEYKEIQHYAEIRVEYGQKALKKTSLVLEKFIIIEVEGKAIINNWKFLATIEHTENGNIIRSYSDLEIPEKYKTVKAHCDHCNIDRYRKDSYLVLNTVTNEIKQVGKSCLMDYTNGLSAEVASQFASYFNTIAELHDHESSGGFTRHYIDTFDYLLISNAMVSKYGFISKGKAEENFCQSTVSKIADFMHGKEYQDLIYDTDENKAEVQNMLDWLDIQTSDSQYISNLQVVCKNKYSEYRDCGLLASLPSAYFKAMQKESDRIAKENEKAGQKQSEYYGTIGDKITLSNVTINHVAQYETEYGITHIFKILDENSNIFTWRTNKSMVENKEGNYTAIVDYTQIKGTIKNHSEFRDEKQTELTRCKVF